MNRLHPQVSPAWRALLTQGAGAMEKNLEIFMARRFKRWGMGWTRLGAHCFEALKPSAPQLTNA